MPTYQYRCTACADELEVFQKFTDASLTECPSCSGELRKVYSAVGVVFKGSGFYATDSRKSSSATSSTGSDSSKSSDSGSKSASSTATASAAAASSSDS